MSIFDKLKTSSPEAESVPLGTDGELLLQRGPRCPACTHHLVDHRDYSSTVSGAEALKLRVPCRVRGCECKA